MKLWMSHLLIRNSNVKINIFLFEDIAIEGLEGVLNYTQLMKLPLQHTLQETSEEIPKFH